MTAQQTSTVFGGSAYTGDLTVRYRVVESGADVSALAKEYRELLKTQGKLPETVKNQDGLLVELIGNIPYSYQWGGLFPVTKDELGGNGGDCRNAERKRPEGVCEAVGIQ